MQIYLKLPENIMFKLVSQKKVANLRKWLKNMHFGISED